MKITASRKLDELRRCTDLCRKAMAKEDMQTLETVYFSDVAKPLPKVLDDFDVVKAEVETLERELDLITAAIPAIEKALIEYRQNLSGARNCN